MTIMRSIVLASLISFGSSSGMDTPTIVSGLPVELWTRILWTVIEKLDGTLWHKIGGALTLQRLNKNACDAFTLSNILTRINPTAQDITLLLQNNLMAIPIEIGKAFTTHGADLNTPQDNDGNTLVHLAAIYGEADKLRKLIALGACTDKPNNHGQIASMCVTASQREIRAILSSATRLMQAN